MHRWTLTLTVCLLGLAAAGLAPALGQGAYPERVIRIVVPLPPAGGVDVLARIIAEPLSQRLGQPVVIENKPGAGGNLGAQQVARAQPDGYTLLFTFGGNLTINPFVYKTLGFDAEKDLIPVTEAATATYLLATHPALPARTVSELLALANATPGGLQWGSAPVGTPDHLCGEYLKMLSSAKIAYIPYKGSAQALTDTISGQIAFGFFTIPTASAQVAAGQLRALAVTSKQRSRLMPELPTMEEAGVKGFAMETSYGLLAPAGTAEAIVSRLQQEVAAIVALPAVRARIETLGWEIVGSTPAAFAEKLADQRRVYGRIIEASGVEKH